MGSRASRNKKWSTVAPVTNALVNVAASHESVADSVLAIKDRWAVPTKASISLERDIVVSPLAIECPLSALSYGHRAELSLLKHWKEQAEIDIDFSRSVLALADAPAGEGWVLVNKYSYTVYLRRCQLVSDRPGGVPSVQLVVPADIRPAMLVFAGRHTPDQPGNTFINAKLYPLAHTRICSRELPLILDANPKERAPAAPARKRSRTKQPAINDQQDQPPLALTGGPDDSLRNAFAEIRAGAICGEDPDDDGVDPQEVSQRDRDQSNKVIQGAGADEDLQRRIAKAISKLYPDVHDASPKVY